MTERGAAATRILIVDDHALFRESLARLLAAEPGLCVVGHRASVQEAIRCVQASPVDLVLLDVDLGSERGVDFLRGARERGFQGRVLVVTAGLSRGEALALLAHGAAGIFFKEDSSALLAKAIARVMEGEAWIDQRYLTSVAALRSASDEVHPAGFSQRERDVLRGVFEGLANKEIGAGLQISESSVKATLQQLFEKTGVRTRSQLVRVALERFRHEI
jgi:two-component system nitrate/nitrite response regulator NarL